MSDKHISTQFDTELKGVSTQVLEMGGLVESQVAAAIQSLTQFDAALSLKVLEEEVRVNQMEMDIDRDLSGIIARRQPTASDLRLLIAISKSIANLERVGDEAARVARIGQRLIDTGVSGRMRLPLSDLQFEADLATSQLRKALDAFARLDTGSATQVLRDDRQVDDAFRGILRQLITFMMEDPRTISPSIEILFAAKALERIGDHAKNIAEYVIYFVKGKDVRHIDVDEVERVVLD